MAFNSTSKEFTMQIVKHSKPIAALFTSSPASQFRSTAIMNQHTPVLDISFPEMHNVAQANSWHVNKYYYQASENQWYLVEEAFTRNRISTFVMRAADEEDGRPVGERVNSSGDLWADRFADRPFNVRAFMNGTLPSTEEWFRNFVSRKDVFQQLEMFEAYQGRLRHCSSFEALARLGIVAA
jgi:hypothetical protein